MSIPQKICSIAFPFLAVLFSLSFTVSASAAGFRLNDSASGDNITISRFIINDPLPPPSPPILPPPSPPIKIDWSKVELPDPPRYLPTPKNQQPTVVEVRALGTMTGGTVVSPAPGSCKEGVCIIGKPQPVEPPAPPTVVESAPEPPQPPPSPEPVREPSPQVDPVIVPPPPQEEQMLVEQTPPPPLVVEIPRILPFAVPVSAVSVPVPAPAPPSKPREVRINVQNVKVNAPQNIQPQVVQPVQPTASVSRVIQEVKQPAVTRRPAGVFKRTGLFFRRLFFRDKR